MLLRLLLLGMCGVILSSCVERAVVAPEPYVYHTPYVYPGSYLYPPAVVVERPFHPHYRERVIVGPPRRHFQR